MSASSITGNERNPMPGFSTVAGTPPQAIGDLASAIAGLRYTVTSPMVTFAYLSVWILITLATLTSAARSISTRSAAG
jgi:hypothetical protein